MSKAIDGITALEAAALNNLKQGYAIRVMTEEAYAPYIHLKIKYLYGYSS
jgi:hypothetical protein